MTSAPLRRWPSEAALAKAMRAVEKVCGAVGGVRILADGGFEVLSPDGAKHLAGEGESATIAEKIRKAGG